MDAVDSSARKRATSMEMTQYLKPNSQYRRIYVMKKQKHDVDTIKDIPSVFVAAYLDYS